MEKRRPRWFLYLLGGVLVVVITLIAFLIIGKNNIPFEDNAVEGTYKNGVGPGLTEQLQAAADNSMFRIKLNALPSFHPDTQTGDVCITNSAENTANMQVTITLNATGQVVYESSVLAPGQSEVYGTLNTPLAEGSYEATATVYALSPQTGSQLGAIESDMLLMVEYPENDSRQTPAGATNIGKAGDKIA